MAFLALREMRAVYRELLFGAAGAAALLCASSAFALSSTASLTTALPGADNDLTFTSALSGSAGNATSVTYQAGDVVTPAVAVNGSSILVTYRDQTLGALPGNVGFESSPGLGFSPDGSKICYSQVYDSDLQLSHLWVRDIFGGTPVQITSGPTEDAMGCSWSPDGQTIAYVDMNGDVARTIPATGGTPTVVPIAKPVGVTGFWISTRVVYSPDGKTFAFCAVYTGGDSTHNIFTVPVGGGVATQVSFETNGGADLPNWSPDGKSIVYANDNRTSGPSQNLMTIRVGDRASTLVMASATRGAYSPDGKTISYLDIADNEIEMISVEGGAPTTLASTSSGGASNAWSPDGKTIAYTAYDNGSMVVSLIGADGSHRITTSAGEAAAAIRADGPASALVAVANAPGNDGSGPLAPLSGTLSSGAPAATVVPPVTPPASSGSSGGGSAPNMSLELTADSIATVGAELVYRLRVYGELNWGTTFDTVADATIPSQLTITRTYLDHGTGCTVTGQHVHCDLTWMNPGQSATVLIFTTVESAGTLTANASCFAAGEQDLSDNSTALVLTTANPVMPATASTGKRIVIAPALPGTVKVVPLNKGEFVVGATLTVSPAVKIGGVDYRWQVRSAKGYSTLKGETAPTLHLTGSLAGKQARVIVTKGDQSRTSAPTATIRSKRRDGA
jgi:Tol biopolymer transport system component